MTPLESTAGDTDVPLKYKGLRADVLEELWVPKVYADPEVQEWERQRREKALAALREQERAEEEAARKEDARKEDAIRQSLESPHSAVMEESSQYDSFPLPLESVYDESDEKISWKDFDQDETGTCILLYRGLNNEREETAREDAHLSSIALYRKYRNIESEDVSDVWGTNDAKDIGKRTTFLIATTDDPLLHLTRRRETAERYCPQGVLVTFKIPKAYFLETMKVKKVVLGSGSEQELEFFYQLPQGFIHTIEQRGKPDILRT